MLHSDVIKQISRSRQLCHLDLDIAQTQAQTLARTLAQTLAWT